MIFALLATLALQAAPAAPAAPASAPLPDLLIERRIADEMRLDVGDTLRLRVVGSQTAAEAFTVGGVFERRADPSRIARNELEVRLHLPDLARLVGAPDRVDRFAVMLAPGASPDSAGRWIESLALGTRAYGSQALAEGTSVTFRVVSRFHRAIGIVTIAASAIFLLCVMIIRVDERRRDVGTLRLIGIGARTVFLATALEAVGIALVGSALGAALGALTAQGVNAYYARVYDTSLRFALVTPRIVALAALLGLVLGAAAGVLAAWRLVRTPALKLGER